MIVITVHHRIDEDESWQVSDTLSEDADEKCDDEEFSSRAEAEDEAGMRESQYRSAGYAVTIRRS